MSSVKFSTELSILVQLITGLLSFNGLFLKLPQQHKILSEKLFNDKDIDKHIYDNIKKTSFRISE